MNDQIQFLTEYSEECIQFFKKGKAEKNFRIIARNAQAILNSSIEIGLLRWRAGDNPSEDFYKIIRFISEYEDANKMIQNNEVNNHLFDDSKLIYVYYLLGESCKPVNLERLSGQSKIDGFFGNVVMGYDRIENWHLYANELTAEKRYDIARKTNAVYADILSENMSSIQGAEIGEKLWLEREDDPNYDRRAGGYGVNNERMVDYQLGAILKKIGSTVPTVHAWRW